MCGNKKGNIINSSKRAKSKNAERELYFIMGTIIEFKNVVAFHPGYYIAEIIEDMGISQSEFADRAGISVEMLNNLVNGRTSIASDIARKFSVMLGTSEDVWLNLQNCYE